MNAEQDTFLDAFVQYLDAVQEATCDSILKRQGKPGKIKSAGKRLMDAATTPDLREKAENVSFLVNVLEAQGRLVSYDMFEIKGVADALSGFGPYLEENHGVSLRAGVSSEGNGIGYLDVCLGKSVTVEKGALRSTIFVENTIEQTSNRLTKERGSATRTVSWTDSQSGTCCYDLDARTERAMIDWRRLVGLEKEDEEDSRQVQLRKLAYKELFEKFKDDGEGFAKEVALSDITMDTAPHEFHHEKLVEYFESCRHIREACAYLYSISKAQGPEGVFGGLYAIYRLRSGLHDETYRSASIMALDYLDRAGYSEEDWRSLGPDGHDEKKRAISSRIAKQAKEALKMIETECSLRKHEELEEILKPDFEGYGRAVRDAVNAVVAQER